MLWGRGVLLCSLLVLNPRAPLLFCNELFGGPFGQWRPTPVLLPGKSHGHGRRSLVGYSPWGREESDMTERLHFHFLALRLHGYNRIQLKMNSPGLMVTWSHMVKHSVSFRAQYHSWSCFFKRHIIHLLANCMALIHGTLLLGLSTHST